MKLLLRRNYDPAKKGTFSLHVRGQFTEAEQAAIKRCNLGNWQLYENSTVQVGLIGTKTTFVSVWVNHLAEGKVIETKEFMELLGAEEEIRKEAAKFASVLKVAVGFGGEEVIEL